jgi:hypothetical protein
MSDNDKVYSEARATLLEAHRLWMETDGAEGTRLDLSGANLAGADLRDANFTEANLSGVNLYGAVLSEINLSGANLSCAYLFEANLFCAYLSNANLSRANMRGADLTGAIIDTEWTMADDKITLTEEQVKELKNVYDNLGVILDDLDHSESWEKELERNNESNGLGESPNDFDYFIRRIGIIFSKIKKLENVYNGFISREIFDDLDYHMSKIDRILNRLKKVDHD